MKNYALGYAFNVKEMFRNFPTKSMKIKWYKCIQFFKTEHKEEVAAKIFVRSFEMVLNDIIENNVTFQLPTGCKPCDIHMDIIQGDDFIKAKQRGKFKNVDYLDSNFTGYQLGFFMYSNGITRKKPIYVSKELRNRIDSYTNQGKTYC